MGSSTNGQNSNKQMLTSLKHALLATLQIMMPNRAKCTHTLTRVASMQMVLQSKSREKHEEKLGVNATYAPYPEECNSHSSVLATLDSQEKSSRVFS